MARNKEEVDKLLHSAYEAYYESSYYYCIARTKYAKGSEEDSVQNAFLIYYKKLLAGESFKNIKAFLYRTCENMCRQADTKFLRDSKRSVDFEDMTDLPAKETDLLASELDYDKIKEELLLLLSAEEQELFSLKYEQGKSLTEIGDILGISPNAASLRFVRLRKKIKTLVTITIDKYREGGIL
ncbi:MAG: sigma-70 family RNA polymerase sigma factor [Eubacterium sp.]|nr:sigma-70 family RNA polymerase sigma factor [Eubacterium sp.]